MTGPKRYFVPDRRLTLMVPKRKQFSPHLIPEQTLLQLMRTLRKNENCG
jgi:hypothetical protein